MSTEDEALFRAAVDSEGDDYLAAEQALLTSESSVEAVRAALAEDDPIAQLLARVVLDAAEADTPLFAGAEAYVAMTEDWFTDTILGTPPLRGVVTMLGETFGAGLGDYLALRLVKLPEASPWRQRLALAYLERHPSPAASDALLRYAAATTTAPELQVAAASVLRMSGDGQLAAKLASERDRLARDGRTLPDALTALIA
jgi:hypothetical protein